MKFLKTLYRILILTVVVFVLLFLWKFLQKQEIIVTNSTKAVITKLQSVNKLESAQMTITKIMEAKKELVDVIPSISFDNILQDVLFKDKIIFELEWKIIAGIDLEKIKTGDVIMNIDGSISIYLPDTEILHIIIDENSKPYDRQIWVLTKGDKNMETMIRNKAKEEMKIEAIENWILKIAKKNALENITKLFDNFDIKIK